MSGEWRVYDCHMLAELLGITNIQSHKWDGSRLSAVFGKVTFYRQTCKRSRVTLFFHKPVGLLRNGLSLHQMDGSAARFIES